jgi:hypothetical protein
MVLAADQQQFQIRFGLEATGRYLIETPVLAGVPVEELFAPAREAGQAGPYRLFCRAGLLLGIARHEAAGGTERAAASLYRKMFAAVRGRHLARLWNYVPAINEPGEQGLENYRGFSRGRSLAFEAEYGTAFKRQAPASSAVGCGGKDLVVVFVATGEVPRHFENPRQVPAYEYPPEYGPRPPTFTRASVVADGAEQWVFISGTAAVRGHATVAPFDVKAQLGCTLDNLREISAACGLGRDLAVGDAPPVRRWFKVYLREAADLAVVQAGLEAVLLRPGDGVTYLRADICRRELGVEIEVTLRRPGRELTAR